MKKAFLRAGAIILISNVVVTTQVGPVTSWNTTKVVEAKKKKTKKKKKATKVYITPTGSKYHLRACGRGHYYKVKLSDAKARGLTKCKKCYR